ncbi:MAG: glycoside hydrolase, partial [Nitrososphaera sp.]|nr:glycoside hydrolase [Nitrososphaera sp.]
LSNNPGFSEHPQAAVYNGSFYAVWADDSSGNREVLFTRSLDNATTFEKTVNLSNNTSDSFNQEMAASGNGVYVVWLDEDDSGGRVLLRASADGGDTFGSTVVISDKANSGSFPKVAADGDSVYVSWNVVNDEAEDGLFYVKSDNNGKTFSNIMKLNRHDNFGEPQIAVKDRVVYVVSGGLEVIEVPNLFFAKSIDGGDTFLDGEIEGNGTFVNPVNVELIPDASSSGLLYVVGQVFVSGNEEIILMPLSGGTEILPKPAGAINLSKNPRISECPSIAIAGDNIYVVWEDLSPGNHEILYARGFKG